MHKGFKHTEETKNKIRLARAKQVWSDESNRKRSETLKGRKFSKDSLRKMSDHAKKRFSDKKNNPNYGKKTSKETREKISKSLKGRNYEELHGVKKADKLKAIVRKNRAKQIFPKTDSSIEIKIQNFLKKLGIEFFTHQHMNIKHSYQCDILIPSMNLVIECDGDYWHKYPVGTDIDHIRTKELIKKGFKLLRLWEFEIKPMSLNDFKNKLIIK